MDDYTLHPFIRPGSFVRIDPRQKKIPPVNWHTDHDRRVFFFELSSSVGGTFAAGAKSTTAS
jgi:hypothetical protein